MTRLILLFGFLLFGNIYAQSTYSGEYTLGSSSSVMGPQYFKGKATYSYYENDVAERMYNGRFSYTGVKSKATWDGRSTGEKTTISITGNYKENLKHGLFTSLVTFKVPGQSSMTAKCKANYSNGYANGLWSTTEKNESNAVTFSKNVGSGAFHFKTKELNIRGNMDEQGYLHGVLKWTSGKWEQTLTYDHGFRTKYISKNTQTGVIDEKTDADPVQLENYRKIQEALERGDTSELENIPFRVEIQYHNGIFNKFNESFKNYNYPGSLPGDLAETNNYKHDFIWSAFIIKMIVAQETKSERLEREKKEKERLAEIKMQNDLKNIQTEIEKSKKKVDDAYKIEFDTYGFLSGKQIIYDSYVKLYDHYLEKINNSSDIEGKNEVLNKVVVLSDYVVTLIDQKAKEIRKALKTAETPEEIEQILK